ncbi:ribonuclease H-like domain-containing protein [Tanacetum coccineum]
MKIPIIRKGEYDIWSMRMRQYICHTNHNLWDVIVSGDLEEEPAPTTRETFAPPAHKTAKQLAARRNQERVKSILHLAIPDEYLLKFHNVAGAKSLWEAIKLRFGGNVESKKMQKNVLKHQFENFSTASNESLDKAYDRFQKLISQLEISLIMRNKPDINEIDIDDLYNNLRVYEDELKRSSGSNSASQNLAFLSSENIGSTNKVSTASGDFGVSTAGGINQVPSTLYAHDIAYSFLAQPTTSPQLENEDFQQMDGDDLEELDLRWQVAMLIVRGILLENVDLERIKEEDFMVTMARAMHQLMNLHRKTNDANTEKPKSVSGSVVSNPKINRDSVIIEDWTSDDEEEVSRVQKVRPENQTVKTRNDKSGQNSHKQRVGFRKVKACFVCRSTEHLIKECNFHDKKSQESNLKNVVNTGKWESKPNRFHRLSINTARFVCTARPSINTAKPVSTVKPSISTAMPVYTARPSISTVRPVYASRSIYLRMDNVRPRGSCSPIKRSYYTKPAFRPKDLKQDVKTFRVKNMTIAGKRAVVNTGKGKLDIDLKKSRWVWRSKGNYLDHVSKDSGSFMLKKGHAVMDSGCSSHMTDNKAYLSDYEDFNGGFVGFGSDPKRDELKFNLFSFSQMCDKKNSVLFTKVMKCLILSPSFKLLDESQVVLRAPRKDDVYSLDLKNIIPSRGEFSVARTPQQNGVAERKNRTLIEAARTMLADSL